MRGIVFYKGKLLCVKLKPYHNAIRGDWWCLPGGGLDHGEGIIAGVTREMVEETGVTPKVGELLYVHQFTHAGTDFLEFFFHITNGEDYLDIDLSKASHAADEIAEIAFVDPKTTEVRPEFLGTDPLAKIIAAAGPSAIVSRYGEVL